MNAKRHTTVKVLGIGNSFTNDANFYRQSLNAADPDRLLEVTIAYIGGCPLEKHVALADLHEQDASDPTGRPYPIGLGSKSLKELLLMEPWDVVTIQQASDCSDDLASYRPYAQLLFNYIKRYCPNAKIAVHETWADRSDNARLKAKNKSQQEMYHDLSIAYRTIASELGNLDIIPVGKAFQIVRKRPERQFKPDCNFDFEHAQYPSLPDQTNALCIGWMWARNETGQFCLHYDHHANSAGKFLAALVWREYFLGCDSRQSTFIPEELSMADAVILRHAAHEAVTGH